MRRAGSSWMVVAFTAVVAVALALPSFASALSFQKTSQGLLPGVTGVSGIATGDFTEDGVDDLAVADESGVAVWISNGDGTFTEGETLPISGGFGATAVVVGDFNGDGVPDIAYVDSGFELDIALGNGNGTFETPGPGTKVPLSSYIGPNQIAAGDFNGGTKEDLVLVSGIHNSSYSATQYEVIEENVLGAFASTGSVPVTTAEGTNFVDVAVGDFNGDGKEDLAILSESLNIGEYEENAIYAEVGQGNGTFTPEPSPISLGFTQSGYAYAEATANLNDSGGDDLVVTVGRNYSMVPLLGSSTEFLTLNSSGALENGPAFAFQVAAADLTGDGRDEAIPGYFDGHGAFGVGFSDDAGNLTEAEGSPFKVGVDGFFDSAVATGDFNGDGFPDVALASNASGSSVTQGVAVMINSPQLSTSPGSLEFGDVKAGELKIGALTLKGTGGPAAEVSDVELSGEPGSPFSIVDPTACESLAYEEECELEVKYAPTSSGKSSDTLYVTSDTGPGGSDAISAVPLTGTGLAPGLTLSPSSQDFGSAVIGGTPVSKSLTIESSGNTALSVTKVSLSSEANFKLTGPSACVGSLAAGATCNVSVSFEPTGSAGSRSATLTVETSAGTQTAQLSGTATVVAPSNGGGTAPIKSAKLKVKAPGTVKAGKTIGIKVTITNSGNTALSGLALKVKVPGKLASAPKSVKVGSLGVGKSVTKTIKVKVKPGAAKGSKIAVALSATAGGKTLAKSSGKLKVK